MLRERSFGIGGGVMVAVGTALLAGLLYAGVGPDLFSAYFAVGAAYLLGALFFGVARESRAFRRTYLAAAEEGQTLPPGGPPV